MTLGFEYDEIMGSYAFYEAKGSAGDKLRIQEQFNGSPQVILFKGSYGAPAPDF